MSEAFKSPPSSPVAGTTNSGSFLNPQPQGPVAEPVAVSPDDLQRQAWLALAQAANALAAAASALAGKPVSFNTVPSLSLPPSSRSTCDLSVVELFNEFLAAKARAGRSDRYLRALRNSLSKFSNGRSRLPIVELDVALIEGWLHKQDWAPRTQRGYLSDLRTVLNFAVRRGYLVKNPAAAVELPELPDRAPAIHTPEQAATVLEFARGYDLNICRGLAVRYFAGLRSAETERLAESEIKAGYIEVTAIKSKTRRRRLVAIQPNLRAWLDLGGQLPFHDTNNRMRWFTAALKKKHGIEWLHNVTRHSFVSYHLARFGSAAKTALEAGHTEQMTFAHYRELVTAEAAAEYWAIVPKKA